MQQSLQSRWWLRILPSPATAQPIAPKQLNVTSLEKLGMKRPVPATIRLPKVAFSTLKRYELAVRMLSGFFLCLMHLIAGHWIVMELLQTDAMNQNTALNWPAALKARAEHVGIYSYVVSESSVVYTGVFIAVGHLAAAWIRRGADKLVAVTIDPAKTVSLAELLSDSFCLGDI